MGDDLFPDDARRAAEIRAKAKEETSRWIKDTDARWERKAKAKKQRGEFVLVIGNKLG